MDLRQGRPYDRPVTDEADDEESKAKAASDKTEATKAEAKDDKAEAKQADEKKSDDEPEATKAEEKKSETKKAEATKADEDGDDDETVPPTRTQEALPAADKGPADRASQLEMRGAVTYPDDGPLSAMVRKIDNYAGMVEQVVLVTILSLVVLTAASHAITDRFFHYQLPFKDDVIRAGTFAIAMLAGAFASHQAKHLSMDLISRRLSPRARLFLKVFLGLFVIFMVTLLIRSGFHNIDNEKQFAAEDKLITRVRIAWLIPIGGFMIIFHTVLHAIIDVDYIARRKTPPERMRSGH